MVVYAINIIETSVFSKVLEAAGLSERARILSQYVSIKLGII